MNKLTTLMLMNNNKEKGRRFGIEYEDWKPMEDPESRFRDRRGREHYDNGRYAPQSNMPYRRDYMPPRSAESWIEYNDRGYPSSRYDGRGMPQQVYFDPSRHWPTEYRGPEYNGREEDRRMRAIGFGSDWGRMDGSDASVPNYNEMDRMPGNRAMSGYSESTYMPEFNDRMAKEWTAKMENEDGSRGPHWTIEQTKQVQAQRGITCDPLEFWVAINAMYSDYCKVAKTHNANTIEFYADMAKAFLDDKDAKPDKLALYYTYIVK